MTERMDYLCEECGREYAGVDGLTRAEWLRAVTKGYCCDLCREEAEAYKAEQANTNPEG